MHNQRRDLDSFEVFRKVCFREGLDAVILSLNPAHHSLPPPVVSDPLRNFRSRTVIAIERERDVLVELRSMLGSTFAYLIEHLDRQSSGILVRLDHDWWNGADQYGR